MMFHFYADDTQIYFSFDSNTPELVTVSRLEACVKDVSDWMSSNKLKLNSDKLHLVIVTETESGLLSPVFVYRIVGLVWLR